MTDVDERVEERLLPEAYVQVVCKRKAEAAVQQLTFENRVTPGLTVIAADTVVALDGEIFGKPEDAADAKRMLLALQDRTHQVFTGITLATLDVAAPRYITDICVTNVTFKALSRSEIIAYIETGEPLDKAGSYAVQGVGASLIEKVDGDFNNVVGISTVRLKALLSTL